MAKLLHDFTLKISTLVTEDVNRKTIVYNEMVDESSSSSLGTLVGTWVSLSITCEMICHHKNVLNSTLTDRKSILLISIS